MKRHHQLVIFGLLLAVLTGFHPLPASGAPGDPDNTFVQQGTIDQPITAVAVDLFGNIWIGGRFSNVYGQGYPYLAVLNPNGTLNTHFTSASLFSIGVVHAIDVDDTGNVYVGGQYGMGRLNYVANTQSWTVDTAFTTQASQIFHRCDTLTVDHGFGQPAQTVFGAGNVFYTNNNNTVIGNMACLHINGTLNPGFIMPSANAFDSVVQIRYVPPCSCGPNTIGIPYLLLSGSFGVMMVDTSGLINFADADYLNTSCAAMRSLAAQNNCPSSHGEIIRGGFFYGGYFANNDQFTPFHLERLGGSDPSWFHSINGYLAGVNNGYAIAAIDALDGGDMVVAGLFSQIDANNINNFAHLLPDGSVDQSFNNNAGYPVFAMTRQPDGKYILAGETGFTPEGGIISRRFGLPATRPVTFFGQPPGTTLFVGESSCLQSGADAWPPPPLLWYKNNNPLTNETGSSICISGATTNDAADYFLRATPFCGSSVDSPTIHLTVLPPPPPPPNDLFANAYTLTGTSAIGTSYIRSATVESGEPNHAGQSAGRSVWWKWTAPFNGRVRLTAAGSEFPAALGVYRGTAVNSLTLVTNGFATNLVFTVVSNTTYRVAVGGPPQVGSMGNILIQLNPVAIIPSSLIVNNGFSFQATGPDTGSAIVEVTTSLNPANWYPVSTNPLVNGVVTFTDPRPFTNATQFYRIHLP